LPVVIVAMTAMPVTPVTTTMSVSVSVSTLISIPVGVSLLVIVPVPVVLCENTDAAGQNEQERKKCAKLFHLRVLLIKC
jgi:hypothetical protein